MQVNPNLADWFAGDPVERIVNLENSLIARKREVEKFFLDVGQFLELFGFQVFNFQRWRRSGLEQQRVDRLRLESVLKRSR